MTNTLRLLAASVAVLALASCGGKTGEAGNAAGANAAVAVTGNATGSATAPAAAPSAPAAPAVDPNEKRMAIEALPVAQAGPGAIVGKMHMIRSASGIETDGIGGGCMVIEDPASKVCHADSDCKVPKYVSAAGGPWAYCAESKCWIKPADKAFCWKSRYSTPPTPFQVGKPQSTPEVKLASLPAQLLQGPAKNQVRARVIACLNGKFGAVEAPPCAGGKGKRSDSIGEAKTFTR
ncbi:MAG TPA: hypothetical protein VN640_11130 [Sphingomicrobium sp.]|jgi:hypothetical protein|nr:hypothetical protein [Sphingomicrobium sp.]